MEALKDTSRERDTIKTENDTYEGGSITRRYLRANRNRSDTTVFIVTTDSYMTPKEMKNKTVRFFLGEPSSTQKIGVDRKSAKPRPSKKSFSEIAEITFKRHEKSFEKLAE